MDSKIITITHLRNTKVIYIWILGIVLEIGNRLPATLIAIKVKNKLKIIF